MKRVLVGVLALVAVSLGAYEGRKFVPYRDIGGVLTVCDGHTGPGIVPGKTYTAEECDDLLASDLYRTDADISACIHTPLPENVRAAANHFAFNVGGSAFCRSTFARLLNERRFPEACAQISRWTFIAGKDCRDPKNRCSGIVKRRAHERKMCEGK